MEFKDEKKERIKNAFKETVNRNGMDTWCNTPDFIIAEYLYDCLESYSKLQKEKDRWEGKSYLSQTSCG